MSDETIVQTLHIAFRPDDEHAFITTNIGEFRAGDSRLLLNESDIREGRRLVANGDGFVDLNADPAEDSRPAAKRRGK
jgi:hypothetical protein